MRMHRLLVSAILTALLSTLISAVFAPAAAHADDPSWATCTAQTVPVLLTPTGPTYNVSGRLCLRTDSVRGSKTVELMVPGLTYDQTYFNSSYLPNTYSYVFAATSRGYSTFVIDRLGTGLSDKPAPDLLTIQSHAYVVGQIVQKLRAGTIGGRAFTTVVGIGHSFGTGILQYLAGTATVAATIPDYLVLGSYLTATYTPTLVLLGNSLHAATADPKFASSGLATGYITTVPGTRDDVFYRTAGAEAAAITYDETNKALATTAERNSVSAARAPAVIAAIKVPVLIVVGQYDALVCNEATGLTCASAAAVKTRELPNFTNPKACLSTYVVLDAGHSYGMHIKARDAYNASHDWVDRYTITGTKDTNGCVI